MSAYLTETEALKRLSSYNIDEAPTAGDLQVASLELDSMGPWADEKTDTTGAQERAFPRGGDQVVPDAILDAVALIAYAFAQDDEPPITSETFFGHQSVTYATPKESPYARRVRALISPYRAGDASAGSLELSSSFSDTYPGYVYRDYYGLDPWGYPIGASPP